MAIDTSIYGNIKPVQIDSPVNMLAQVAQLQGAQNQNRLFDMQVADRESAKANENALAEAYRNATDPNTGAIDRNKLITSLAQSGQGAKLPAIQKGFTDQDKSARDAKTAEYDMVTKELALQAQVLGTVKDQNSWNQALSFASQKGIDVSKFPQLYDPAFVDQLKQRNLTTAQQYEQEWKQKNFDLEKDKFKYQQGNDAANRSVTIRGQNMTDSRAREATAQGRIPAGYRANPDGTLSAIPGGPADASTGAGAKPTADYLKQAEAYQNMDDAITGYTSILKNFGLIDAANPTKRAELDSAYQNALLQAKEIYKLGVLNGGDERIIKGVINRPLDLSSAFIPKEALIKQATDLQGIIKRGNENLAKVNKQKVVPLNSEEAAATTPSASTQKAGGTMSVTNAADYAKVPSGALYVTPDGQTRKKP